MEFLPVAALFPFPLATRAARSSDAIADTLLRPPAEGELTQILLVIAAAQLLAILSYWIASNILTKEKPRLGEAVKVWLVYFGCALAASVLIYGMFYLRVTPRSAMMVALGLGLLFLVVLFVAPMKIYNFRFPRALGFVLMSGVLITAGQTLAMRFLPAASSLAGRAEALTLIATLPAIDRQRLAERLLPAGTRRGNFAQNDTIAADRNRSIPERHAALQELYRDLAARRTSLQQNDSAGLAAYQRDQARYELLLLQLQTDAAAGPR